MRKSQAVLLLEANAEIETLKNTVAQRDTRIAELDKKLESEKTSYSNKVKERNEIAAELEQVHLLIDALPVAVAREVEGKNSWDNKNLNVLTRLAVFMASKI